MAASNVPGIGDYEWLDVSGAAPELAGEGS